MKNTLLLLSLIAVHANAQIIYTDVIPDTLLDGPGTSHYYLDLNNDGTSDFDILYNRTQYCGGACTQGTVHTSWVWIAPVGTNAWVGSASRPEDLIHQTVIDASSAWDNSVGILASNSSHCLSNICAPLGPYLGEWFTGNSLDTAKYLGLRFSSGGATYHGWARLSIPHDNGWTHSITLKDYAYNSAPDEFILAGDTGVQISTGIGRIAHPNVQVSPNPFSSTLSVSYVGQAKGAITCTVRALTGQALVTRSITGSSGQSPFTTDLASLAPGVYMLDVVIDGDRIVRKVMKE